MKSGKNQTERRIKQKKNKPKSIGSVLFRTPERTELENYIFVFTPITLIPKSLNCTPQIFFFEKRSSRRVDLMVVKELSGG